MTSEQRKAALQEFINKSTPAMTGITLMYHGERETFDAYRIPLSLLTYNPYNGRIGSAVKSYERQHHPLDLENPEDVKIIENFLWKSKEDANKRTMISLLKEHQQRYGIVTADGKIIDGNRRASLLNRIWRDESIPPSDKVHTQYFLAIVLPIDADKKEILRLETTYQMGEDSKVDYAPIEKYLKAGDLAAEGFSNDEIASFMGVKPKDVKTYLAVLKLMNDYLDEYNYSGIYTALDTREDSFLKLETALNRYKSGGLASMWAYDAEIDVADLKSIAFDYIRLGFDQEAFRDIIRSPTKNNGSFFSSENIWKTFVTAHFDAVDAVKEKSVDEIIHDNPTDDIGRLLRARDEEWRKNVKKNLEENFQRAKDKLTASQQAAEPLKLMERALTALSAVDITQETFKKESAIRQYIADIEAKLQEFAEVLK